MRSLKMLSLAIATAAFMAFAGSTSAQTVTSPGGTEYTGSFAATGSGSQLMKAGFANITCTAGTFNGTITTNTNTHAEGPLTTLALSSCNATVVTLAKGRLTFQKGTRTVFGFGQELTVSVHGLGTSCVFGTSNGTDLGTGTSGTTTVDATLTFNANLPLLRAEGFGCGPVSWSGSYKVTAPTPWIFD